jgi:hypothetical protein
MTMYCNLRQWLQTKTEFQCNRALLRLLETDAFPRTDMSSNQKDNSETVQQSDAPESTEARRSIDHEIHESSLISRTPSREENNAILAELHNTATTASIRRTLHPRKASTYHEPVEFNWGQFWKTFVYENLPPIFGSPLAALLLEKDAEAAWHTIQHRALLPTSTKYRPLGSIIGFWVVFYPFYFIIVGALVVRLLQLGDSAEQVDLFLPILGYFFLFLRTLIISVKYAYLRDEDVAQLTKPPPNWDEESTNRRLIMAGWRTPAAFKGLIEDELTCAMDENDIALQGMSFRVGPEATAAMRRHPTNDLFTAATPHNEKDQVTAGFVLHQLIRKAYHIPFPNYFYAIILGFPVVFAMIPCLVRWQYGLDVFGEGWTKLIHIGVIIGSLNSFSLLAFGLISAHDFGRRENAMERLGKLIQYPGIPLKSFLVPLDNKAASMHNASADAYVHVDLKDPDNVFAWFNCRKTLRAFGEPYFLRIQSYTSILLSYAIFCVVVLNIIVWSQVQHHVSTIYFIFIVVLAIAVIAILSINKATKLQSLSQEHRELLKKEIFLQEKILIESPPELTQEDLEKIKKAQALLAHVDESIHYQEEVHNPTTVLGQPATHQVFSSTLGLLFAGINFAWGGFFGAQIVYDNWGWFGF